MGEITVNLDKLAAEQAQRMIQTIPETARQELEQRAQKEGKPFDEKEHKRLTQKWLETLERLAAKTLGVLQEQGIYAMVLFLHSRTSDEEKVAKECIMPYLLEMLKELPPFQNDTEVPAPNADVQKALKFYTDKVLGDLDTLLLVRDLYEQSLIYARYGAKALEEKAQGSGG